MTARQNAWLARHPDYPKEYGRLWYANNTQRKAAYNLKYYETHARAPWPSPPPDAETIAWWSDKLGMALE